MSNPNIVYLANESPRPSTSTSTSTAEPTVTITSNTPSNQAQFFPNNIQQPPPPGITAYLNNVQGNFVAECHNNLNDINPPVMASDPGYYDLAPNAMDVSLNYASGYCEFDSNNWITPSIEQINEMAVSPYSGPNIPTPTQSSSHPLLDTSDCSKKYNQEVDKFLNRIKLNDDVGGKITKAKNNPPCECSKYKKYKTSVKHVPIKKTITSKNIKDNPKVSSGKTKMGSQNRTKIYKIKKQIDLIENEIQRRKTELSIKEQQIQNEINLIQQKQPLMIINDTNQLATGCDNEQDMLDGQASEGEHTTNEIKSKPQIKSVVNISRNINLKNSNNYNIDYKMRRKSSSKRYNNHPYTNPLKVKSLDKNLLNSNLYENNNMNINFVKQPQIKTERLKTKIKENIVISLNLEQDLHSSNKQFTISQRESADKNEKEIHLTIRITENDNLPNIKTANEEKDGSVIDLSFLDEIDVDEIVECLNVSENPMETDVTATESYNLQNLKNDNNTNCMKDAPNNLTIGSTEHEKENTKLSSLSESKVKKPQGDAQDADYNCTQVIKRDHVYDEFMEICNVINDPGFMKGSLNAAELTNEKSLTGKQVPLALDCLSDSYDPVIIKTCTIETETFNKISECDYKEMAIQENIEADVAPYVNEDFKDDLSESAASLTSYSNCTEYDYNSNNNNTLEHSDTSHEDIELDDNEQRANNLLLSIFNNPELFQNQAMRINKPKHYIASLEQIGNRKNTLDIDEKMPECRPNSNFDHFGYHTNYHKTETLIFEDKNHNKELFEKNKGIETIKNIDTQVVSSNNQQIMNTDDASETNSNNKEQKSKDISYQINNETIGDHNNNSSKITKDNEVKSCNAYADSQVKLTRICSEIVSGNVTCNSKLIKEESKNIEVVLEEPQSESSDNNVSIEIFEISEKQLVEIQQNNANKTNLVTETDDDVVIMIPEPSLATIDLTEEESERKKTRKKITYNEISESAQEENITKTIVSNEDENVILPQIEPLKSARDFALALKLEQGITTFFNSEHEITGIIKRGMYSDIYRARNKNTGQMAVAKVIRNRKDVKLIGIQKSEWMKELQEGIPKEKYHCLYLLHALVVDGMWCFVLEYYPKNLEQVLMERGRGFCIETVQKLARQLVSAVLLLRNHKIIHSDITPKHILLDATNNNLKLGGFDESFQRVHIKSTSCIGTVHYRAPELILGYFVGHGIDVWATGLVLYEMTTNIKLFPANTNNEVLYQQLCTVGPVPVRMLTNSKYKEFHYKGDHFFRDGMDPMYKRKPRIVYRFLESERINNSLFGAYTKHWARIRSEHKDADYATINQFCKLLKQMLLMDPYCRIGIESVYAHGFIYE